MSENIVDRIEFDGSRLDEIVAARGAHLEHMGRDRWFLAFYHEDGTETAIWFTSKDLKKPPLEKRFPRHHAGALPADTRR
ncbi:hypothetical protein [Mesorhizobium sp. A556]